MGVARRRRERRARGRSLRSQGAGLADLHALRSVYAPMLCPCIFVLLCADSLHEHAARLFLRLSSPHHCSRDRAGCGAPSTCAFVCVGVCALAGRVPISTFVFRGPALPTAPRAGASMCRRLLGEPGTHGRWMYASLLGGSLFIFFTFLPLFSLGCSVFADSSFRAGCMRGKWATFRSLCTPSIFLRYLLCELHRFASGLARTM